MGDRTTEPRSKTANGQESSRLVLLIFRGVLLVVLTASCVFGIWHTSIQKEFAQASDRFGYLQMAADLRRGNAPNDLPPFTFDSPQSRLMLAFLRDRGLPVDNSTSVGPAAYHYVAATDRIICQYPPGVGMMLSLFPEGQAVLIWRIVEMALLAALAATGIFRVIGTGNSVLAATLMTLTALCGILIAVLAVSYSVDMVIIPLVLAVGGAFESRRSGWAGWLLIALAGLSIGWAVVMRLTAAFFLPGLLPLAWSAGSGGARKRLGRLIALLAAFAVGVFPLLYHQHLLTGSWFHSTYTPVDVSAPSLSHVAPNLAYYLTGAGNDLVTFFAIGIAAFALWLIAARRLGAGIFALLLWIAVPTAYFLSHTVATPYYQFSTIFVALLAMAWIVHKHVEQLRMPWLAPIAAWAVLAFLVLQVVQFPWPTPDLVRRSAKPDTTLPAEFEDPRAMILADRLAGTLWFYDGIPSLRIADLDAQTRLAFLKFAQARGNSVLIIADNPTMVGIINELEEKGVAFTEAGTYCPLEQDKKSPFTSIYRVNP